MANVTRGVAPVNRKAANENVGGKRSFDKIHFDSPRDVFDWKKQKQFERRDGPTNLVRLNGYLL
jgi:hypothetical protein